MLLSAIGFHILVLVGSGISVLAGILTAVLDES